MKLYLEDNWQDPNVLQDEFINQMSNSRWQPAVEITITELPIGSEVVINKDDEQWTK